jgi:hypothetical protein
MTTARGAAIPKCIGRADLDGVISQTGRQSSPAHSVKYKDDEDL